MMKSLLIIILSGVFALCAKAGDKCVAEINDTINAEVRVKLSKIFFKGDSITNQELPVLYCYPEITDKSKKAQYDKMVRNIKYVYPYAQLVRRILLETYEYIETLPPGKEREQHIKAVEKGIKEQYEPTVRKISRSNGKLLVKLIDRECHQTCYQMIKAFCGPVKANFYQGIAYTFGYNLNKHYHPEDEDKEIERIVQMVESNQL